MEEYAHDLGNKLAALRVLVDGLDAAMIELEQENNKFETMINSLDDDHVFEFAPILDLWRLRCKVRERKEE